MGFFKSMEVKMLLTKFYLLIYFSTCFGQSETSRMILGLTDFCCNFVKMRWGWRCRGVSCEASCSVNCGLLQKRDCGPYKCSDISRSCVLTVPSTTTAATLSTKVTTSTSTSTTTTTSISTTETDYDYSSTIEYYDYTD